VCVIAQNSLSVFSDSHGDFFWQTETAYFTFSSVREMYFVGYFDKMSRRVVAEVMVYQSVVGCIWLKFLRVLVYMTAVSRTLGSFIVSFGWSMS